MPFFFLCLLFVRCCVSLKIFFCVFFVLFGLKERMKSLLSCGLLLGTTAIDVDKLLNSMTLEEKIGQLNQITIAEFVDSNAVVDYQKVN